jgi:hypothetical protein
LSEGIVPAHDHGVEAYGLGHEHAVERVVMHGQSVQEQSTTGSRRAILTRVELLSAAGGDYGWLNTSFIVGEGEIEEETEDWWVQAYVCINEVVQHPPAIGDVPPERFRQAGS